MKGNLQPKQRPRVVRRAAALYDSVHWCYYPAECLSVNMLTRTAGDVFCMRPGIDPLTFATVAHHTWAAASRMPSSESASNTISTDDGNGVATRSFFTGLYSITRSSDA